MPGDMYLKDPDTVASWKFGLTTVDWRKEDLKKRMDKSARLVSGEEEVELKASGEEGILLIKALCGLERVLVMLICQIHIIKLVIYQNPQL